MIIFENDGEIDPRLVTLIGVNVKEGSSPIGFFGTGLKYAVACINRWGEEIRIQSGTNEFNFASETTTIRGKEFGLLSMYSKFDRAQLGFTTDLGKRWEPWMVYRELWCNAYDEPNPRVYRTDTMPSPAANITRIVVDGQKMLEAHFNRNDFILGSERIKLHKTEGLEIYEGICEHIFYRGIAVQKLNKPAKFTYNITEHLYLTEDRTASSWSTNPIIAQGLALVEDENIVRDTMMASDANFESGLDYCYVNTTSAAWKNVAENRAKTNPLTLPTSVRVKFIQPDAIEVCPTCGRAT